MDWKPIFKAAVTAVLAFITMGLIPYLGLFAFNAFETELAKATLYYGLGGIALICVLALAVLSVKFKWAIAYLFEPSLSLFGDTPFEKYITVRRVIHFGILLGLILSYVSIITQTSFVALPSIEQQVTATGQIILSAEPAASSETLVMVAVISLLVGLSVWFIDKYDLPEITLKLFLFLICVLNAGIWTAFHLARYGASETNLGGTAFFGFFGSLMTVLSGSPLPWYIWHVFLNIFVKMKEIFSSELAQNVILGIIIFYVIALVIGFIIRQRK